MADMDQERGAESEREESFDLEPAADGDWDQEAVSEAVHWDSAGVDDPGTGPADEAAAARSPRLPQLVLAPLLVAAALVLGDWDRPTQVDWSTPVSHGDSVPDQIVVDLVDDVSAAEIQVLAESLGIRLEFNSIHAHDAKLMVATVPPAARSQILIALAASDLVESAEPLYLYRTLMTPDDAEYAKQWHLRAIGMEAAWEVTAGEGVVVAVLDTGVAIEQVQGSAFVPDLAGTKWVRGYDFADDDEIADDAVGHGTHVAGTIAQSTNNGRGGAGVAFEATIMPVKVLGSGSRRGRSLASTSSDIADGIRFAADHGCHVINLSLGGPDPSSVIESAIEYAHGKGVTIVCAAGNSSKAERMYPAAFAHCIAVSAVGPNEELTPYSTWGDHIDVAAPGGDMSSAGGGDAGGVFQSTVKNGQAVFAPLQGTSMASPHVAGVAALIHSLGVEDPVEIRNVLRRTARPKGPANKYGTGLLDAAAAVRSVPSSRTSTALMTLLVVGLLGFVLYARQNPGLIDRAKHHRMEIAFCVLGLVAPDLLKNVFGHDSTWNLLGHGVIVPAVLMTRLLQDARRARLIVCATLGLASHLLFDWVRGVVPFPVLETWRVTFWYLANLVAAAVIVWLHVRTHGAKAGAMAQVTQARPATAAGAVSGVWRPAQ